MNRNRTWVLVGVLAGAFAVVALALVVSAMGAGRFLDEWAGWISVIGFAAVGLFLGYGRWRQGGWDSVRRVWWLFAFWTLYVAARIADALNIW